MERQLAVNIRRAINLITQVTYLTKAEDPTKKAPTTRQVEKLYFKSFVFSARAIKATSFPSSGPDVPNIGLRPRRFYLSSK